MGVRFRSPKAVTSNRGVGMLAERAAVDAVFSHISRAIAATSNVDEVLQEICNTLAAASPHLISVSVCIESCDGSVRTAFFGIGTVGGLGESFSVPIQLAGGHHGVLRIQVDDSAYIDRLGTTTFENIAALIEIAWSQLVSRRHLETLASTDDLTTLLNRRALEGALESEHERAAFERHPYALVLFDLDRFKLVNDAYGHHTGDEVLTRVAQTVRKMIRKADVLGRWGGEEFLCILPGNSAAQAARFAERLQAAISASTLPLGNAHRISASFGVASYPEHGASVETILGRADMALYRAKREGRDRIVVARADNQGLYYTGNCVVEALENGGVRVAYQPIVDLKSGETVAEEALARIHGANGELLAAGQFIDIAEDLHLAHRIDNAVIPQVLDCCSARRLAGEPCILHFVNITLQLLRYPEEVQRLLRSCTAYCPHRASCALTKRPIVLEITERISFHDIAQLRAGFQPFLDAGYQLAIDDFGSGYAPLVYLTELPVSFIKLDRHLTQNIRDPRARTIARGICQMSDDLGATTIAEGVEDEATAQVLREVGVDWAQGYYFGRPQLSV